MSFHPSVVKKHPLGSLFILLLSLLPVLSFAADGGDSGVLFAGGTRSIFNVAPQDISLIYLGQIFGTVGTVLAGSGSTLMSTLFGIFNPGILALGIIFAIYTTVMGIMNSAAEGEFLGKKMSSIWTPIRSVLGIALLIPLKTSGYCVVQVFFMWLIIQGVGLADTMWNATVKYIVAGNPVYVTTNTSSYSTYDTTVQVIYEGLACQQSLYDSYSTTDNTADTTTNTTPKPPEPVIADNVATYTFQGTTSGYNVTCGVFSFPIADAEIPGDGSMRPQDISDTSIMAKAKMDGLTAIMPTLNSVAYYYITYPDNSEKNQATFQFVGGPNFLSDIQGVYNSFIVQGASIIGNRGNDKAIKEQLIGSTQEGWLTAGGYYYSIASISNSVSQSAITDSMIAWDTDKSPNELLTSDSLTSILNDTNDAGKFIQGLAQTRDKISAKFEPVSDSTNASGAFGINSGLISKVGDSMIDALGSSTNLDTNPVISASKLGSEILLWVQIFWTVTVGATLAGAMIAGWKSSINAYWLAFKAVMAFVMPVVIAVAGMLIILGGTLAVMVPMTPYIIFAFASINWFIVTIETMVAAPVVALGLMHPEGHEVWGKAEPAVMMIINVFLRPGILIISLMAAMLLSFVACSVINLGFGVTMEAIADNTHNSPMETMLFVTLYVAITLAAINKSFSLIATLPNAVMGWIQGGEVASRMGGDFQQDVSKAQDQYKQEGGGAAKELGSSAGQGSKEGLQAAEAPGYEKRMNNRPEGNDNKNVGGEDGENPDGGGNNNDSKKQDNKPIANQPP